MNSICAIVVTYNRPELLQKCLTQLQQQTAPCTIYIVDNNSTVETKEVADRFCLNDSNIYYRNTGTNLGGAGGFNYGMKWAIADGFEYLWIMDDDTFPETDTLELLMKTQEEIEQPCGWLSSRILWSDGSDCLMNRQKISPYRDIHFSGDKPIKSAMASFVSLLIPRETVLKYGYPISEFFIWGDDWEYTRRISRNLLCYTVPKSICKHLMKQNSVVNIATDTPDRLSRYTYFYRNDVYLYRREGLGGWIWLLFKDIWHSVQVIIKGKDSRNSRLKTIWKGFASGCHFHPAIDMAGETNGR